MLHKLIVSVIALGLGVSAAPAQYVPYPGNAPGIYQQPQLRQAGYWVQFRQPYWRQQEFGSELEAAGGMLKTGIYNPGIGVQDIGPRFAAAYKNARRTPFLRRLFPVHETVRLRLRHHAEQRTQPYLG